MTCSSLFSFPTRLLALFLAALLVVAVLAGCSASATTAISEGSSVPPIAEATPVPTPSAEPTAVPVELTSPLPAVRPADFEAGYSEGGGMAPWSEDVDIGPADATYEVWMNYVTYTFNYTPTERQLDFVYDEVRLGRFHEYEVIPFADDEMIYDAGTTGYTASAGDYSHRIFESGQDIASPGTGHTPLAAMSQFVDLDSVPEASDRLTIVFDNENAGINTDLEIVFSLTGSTFAMGEERWADTFEIAWSGGPREVQITILRAAASYDEDAVVESEQLVSFEPGGTIRISAAADGSLVASAA